MFENIRKQIVEEETSYLQSAEKCITEDETALERNSTNTRWNQYKTGKIDRATAVGYALARLEKRINKAINEKYSRLDRYAIAPDVESIDIFVEWKRNRTWGYNPTATVNVHTGAGTFTATGSASGCGYDKRTAAVGSALNKIDAIKKMLCTCKENAIKAEKKSKNPLEINSASNQDYIAYGAGYGAIPYFEGGVGMSSFECVFNACGFVLDHCHETKNTDYYYFTKKEA